MNTIELYNASTTATTTRTTTKPMGRWDYSTCLPINIVLAEHGKIQRPELANEPADKEEGDCR